MQNSNQTGSAADFLALYVHCYVFIPYYFVARAATGFRTNSWKEFRGVGSERFPCPRKAKLIHNCLFLLKLHICYVFSIKLILKTS